MQKKEYDIISFYKFCPIETIEDLRIQFKKNLIDHSIKGTIILSPEGINGTIAGSNGFFKSFSNFVFKKLKIENFDVINASKTSFIPFNKPKVKIKKEVVPIEINTQSREGKHLSPEQWDEFISKEDVMVIDIRKPFEYEMGTFNKAINPNVNNFREFKNYFSKDFLRKNNKKFAIFCTGGIRCEKAADHLKSIGMDEVYQLEGGILNYLNNIKEENSQWNGECYVFDQRVSVKHQSIQGSYSTCHACRMPISQKDKDSKHFIEGVSCPKCFDKLTEDQKKRFAMRQFNIKHARKND